MKLEKRQAHIQIIGHDTCVITTPFKQKTLKFQVVNIIDLIDLKVYNDRFSSPQLSFYDVCGYQKDTYDRSGLGLTIYAKIDTSNTYDDKWGQVGIYGEKEKTFRGVICIK
jgi:hypothetical protein